MKMNLQKDKWKKVKIGDVSTIQYGSSFKFTDQQVGYKTFRMNELVNGIAVDDGSMKKTNLNEKEFNKYKLKHGDILFNRTNSFEHVGRTGMFTNGTSEEYMFASYLLRVATDKRVLSPFFLNTLMNSNWFQTNIKKYATKAVNQANINAKSLAAFEIPLPPITEQTRITELFRSIENSIEQVGQQQKNLGKLCKVLIDELVNDKPAFGNLLKGKKLKLVKYCEVTEKLMRKIEPVSYGIERIVGGENLESEDFKIRTWSTVGKDFLGPAFHVLFKPGDILYGSRRTYLRKVALADFEGVCANTTYVIRAKKDLLLQDLLKHVMLSERFTQYSIGVSKGSTNPYINWKDLDNFSFQIPDLETQKKIAAVLDEIIEIAEKCREQKQTLKNLKQKLLNEILG